MKIVHKKIYALLCILGLSIASMTPVNAASVYATPVTSQEHMSLGAQDVAMGFGRLGLQAAKSTLGLAARAGWHVAVKTWPGRVATAIGAYTMYKRWIVLDGIERQVSFQLLHGAAPGYSREHILAGLRDKHQALLGDNEQEHNGNAVRAEIEQAQKSLQQLRPFVEYTLFGMPLKWSPTRITPEFTVSIPRFTIWGKSFGGAKRFAPINWSGDLARMLPYDAQFGLPRELKKLRAERSAELTDKDRATLVRGHSWHWLFAFNYSKAADLYLRIQDWIKALRNLRPGTHASREVVNGPTYARGAHDIAGQLPVANPPAYNVLFPNA